MIDRTIQEIPILICATGLRARREAEAFLARHDQLHVIVASDEPVKGSNESFRIYGKGYTSKIEALLGCPYESFLYVDTDCTIYSTESLGFFFDRYPLSVSYEPLGATEKQVQLRLPARFSSGFEYQTGVMAVRKTSEVVRFLEAWLDIQMECIQLNGDKFPDQISFRHAAHTHRIPIGVLPSNLNFRAGYHQLISGPLMICHSRYPPSDSICKKVINSSEPRYLVSKKIYLPFSGLSVKLLRFVLRKF